MHCSKKTRAKALPLSLSLILLLLTPFAMHAEQLTLSDKDRLCIEQMEYRYNYAIDTRDWRSLADCFALNGAVRMGDSKAQGRDDVAKWYEDSFRGSDASLSDAMDYCRHAIIPGKINYDGKSANQQSALIELIALKDGRSKFFTGSYDDQWVRLPEGWRLEQRNIHLDVPVMGSSYRQVRVRCPWLRPDLWADRGENIVSNLDPSEWDDDQWEFAIFLAKNPTWCLTGNLSGIVKAVYCPKLDFPDRNHGRLVLFSLIQNEGSSPGYLSLVQFVTHLEKSGSKWVKRLQTSTVDLQGEMPSFVTSSSR